MPKFVAIINTPGYLSEQDEPPVFDTVAEAWQYLTDERKRAENDFEDWGIPGKYTDTLAALKANADVSNGDRKGTGTVYGATPGYEGRHDLGVAYSVQLAEAGEDE